MNNAHTADLIDADTIRPFIAQLPDSDAKTAALALLDSMPTGISRDHRTMKAWMLDNNGAIVDTVQVQWGTPWAPLARTVDASRSTFCELDGSRREYKSMKVVASDADHLIVQGGGAVCAYAVSA